jgi:hypothetical protein
MSEDMPLSRVEIRTTRANDIALGLCGLLLSPLGLWGLLGGASHMTRDDMRGRGEWFALPFYDVFGFRGVVAFAAVLAFWATCLGLGAAWRLWDQRSAVVADQDGIQFHPSVGPSHVPWSDIQSIRWVRDASPPEVEIRLGRRFWSLWNWITSPKVRLNHIAIGLSQREGARRVKALKVLMRRSRMQSEATRERA